MQMDSRIILAGQQPDFVNVLRQSNLAAGEANQVRTQNALRELYQTQGPQIAAGEQGAMNALSRFDPKAALGIQDDRQGLEAGALGMDATRLGMSATQQRMDVLGAQEKRAIQDRAAQLSAAERAEAAEKVQQGLMTGIQLHQAGDLPGLNALLQSVGEQPIQSLDQFPGVAVKYQGVLEALSAVEDFSKGGKQSEAEQEIARIMSTGVDRNTAIKIKEGVYRVITDPVTRESVIIDLATREPISTIGADQQPAPRPVQAAPQAENQPLSFGNRFEGAEQAFGVEGAARRGVNAVTDTLGFGQVYPEVSNAQSDFAVMREDLTNKISAAYDGRVPAFLLKGIQDLTPRAGSVFEGPGEAQSKLRALGRSLQQELAGVDATRERPMSPVEKEALSKRRQVLASSIEQIKSALMGLGGVDVPQAGRGQTKSGISWSVE